MRRIFFILIPVLFAGTLVIGCANDDKLFPTKVHLRAGRLDRQERAGFPGRPR